MRNRLQPPFWCAVRYFTEAELWAVTDENGLFDVRGYDLTLIEMIDRRVGLSLSRGERVW